MNSVQNLCRSGFPARLVIYITVTFLLGLAAAAEAQPLTPFRIANGTSGENPAVLWVGVDQGFYRKHGLNVEVVYMRAGSLAVSALAAGDVNVVLTSSNAVLNIAAGGLDVVIIGSLFNRPEGDFMAPKISKGSILPFKVSAAAVGRIICSRWITSDWIRIGTTSASSFSAISLRAFKP